MWTISGASLQLTNSVNRDEIYKFRAFVPVAALCALSAIVPGLSIFELYTMGSIDFYRPAPGRLSLPMGFYYSLSWILFFYILKRYVLPAAQYISRGYIFRISGNRLTIHGEEILYGEITSYEFRSHGIFDWNRELRIRVQNKEFRVLPGFHPQGVQALKSFLARNSVVLSKDEGAG